jgi:very-short-patch-repair endonuclease
MIKKKIDDLNEAIAWQMTEAKAYNLPKLCVEYNLQEEVFEGDKQEAYSSKRLYVIHRLSDKSDDFILSLSKKLIKDLDSDIIGNALNNYLDGEYFKISKVTRKNISEELVVWGHAISDIPIAMLDKNFITFVEDFLHPDSYGKEDAKSIVEKLNKHLLKDGFRLIAEIDKYGRSIYKCVTDDGVSGKVKNVIFAANGPKPDIVLPDALNNNISIVKNSEYCLVYDSPITVDGLKWIDLVKWWSEKNEIELNAECAKDLFGRLRISISSPPELIFFDTYYREYARLKNKMPALLPQVYLHYDPFSIKRHGFKYLLRQRMDFLLLLNNNKRIVIEIDGVQHYAELDKPSPKLYSSMVSADRELKLLGYEVYRFGGFELNQQSAPDTIKSFFDALFGKHKIE